KRKFGKIRRNRVGRTFDIAVRHRESFAGSKPNGFSVLERTGADLRPGKIDEYRKRHAEIGGGFAREPDARVVLIARAVRHIYADGINAGFDQLFEYRPRV